MEKFQLAVQRYELARQSVSSLKSKRRELVKDCENLHEVIDPYFHQATLHGKLCLVGAYEDFKGDDSFSNFTELLEYLSGEGTVCDACLESYKIKTGALSDARKEFGAAKRALSYLGKKSIHECANSLTGQE